MSHQLDAKEEMIFSSGEFSFSSHDVLRLMLRTLHNLGLQETAQKLEEESGLTLASIKCQSLFNSIREGKWLDAIEMSNKISYAAGSQEDVLALIFELKYFELLECGQLDLALSCLRNNLSKSVKDAKRLSFLASLILASNLRSFDNLEFKFCRTRESLIQHLKSLLSSSEIIDDYRLEELMARALHWQIHGQAKTTLSIPSQQSSQSVSQQYSLLTDHVPKETVDVSMPDHSIVELCHNSEVWCVAFSPDRKMLATATVEGDVKVWLVGENQSLFTQCIECQGSARQPILLRWDLLSSTLLCCCEDSRSFKCWKISSSLETDCIDGANYNCDGTNFDQSYEVVFADFLPSPMTSNCLLISCTRENHIFICDSDNNPLTTYVGGEGVVVAATLILQPEKRQEPSRLFCSNDDRINKTVSGWKRRNQTQGSGSNTYTQEMASSHSDNLNAPSYCNYSACHLLIVANSKNTEISLYHVIVNCLKVGEDVSDYDTTFEVILASTISVVQPVVSLSSCYHVSNEDPKGVGTPLVHVAQLGGNLSLISLKNENLEVSILDVAEAKGSLQSRFVVKCGLDPTGTFVACGGEDGIIRVWDNGSTKTTSKCYPHQLLGHCGPVGEVAWCNAPASSQLFLASASDDCTVRIWASKQHFPAALKDPHPFVDENDDIHNESKNVEARYRDLFCHGALVNGYARKEEH